ncbi:MAG: polyprenyl diphosphate synthase [Candidatus Porifericomitaceae bacterium WSBS_2022_MAG_OTU9]
MLQHLAVIMDGNGRWAQQRGQPRAMGHRAGIEALRKLVLQQVEHNIPIVTVFAFSSENWQRPLAEVQWLLRLFSHTLQSEVEGLIRNGVRISFIGERSAFPQKLCDLLDEAEHRTRAGRWELNVAVNYGGRWDIVHACRHLAKEVHAGRLDPEGIDETTVSAAMELAGKPPPDMMIRTGGEFRISNYLIWQLAYAELYFSDCLWPDFDASSLDKALHWYSQRERRFGDVAP